MDEFNIKFAGLKNGKHEFDFTITNKFFEDLDYSEIREGELTAKMEMDKSETMLVLHFDITGGIETTCDRCAVGFTYPIHSEQRIIIKLGNEAVEESDEVIVIPRTEHSIEVKQFIYEFISLELPVRKTACNDEEDSPLCDKSVIEKIEDKNKDKKEVDPRWAALKKLSTGK